MSGKELDPSNYSASDRLDGLRAIGAAMGGKSPSTVLKLIQREGLPARRMGKSWISHMVVLDEWWRRKVEERSA